MLFKAIIAGVAAAATLVQGAAIERLEARTNNGGCGIAQAAGQMIVGGSGGGQVCESRWPVANFITTITAWSNGNTITALQVGYQDGQTAQYGQGFGGQSQSITLAPGELVTSASLYGNGVGTRLGKINIVTSKQNVMLGSSNAKPYPIDVGSGIIIGMVISSGKEIDSAGLVMLGGKIQKIGVTNFKFNTDPTLNGPPLQPQSLSSIHYYNDDTAAGTYSFTGSSALTSSTAFSSSTTGEFGMEFSWEAEVNILALKSTIGASASWSVSHTTMTTTTETQTNTVTWNQGGTLQPGKGVDCQAVVQTGKGDFPYTATITFFLDNGNQYSYSEPGTLSSVQYTTVDQSCTANNTPQAKANYVSKSVKKTS